MANDTSLPCLLDLTEDALLHVISHLDYESTVNLASSCRALYEAFLFENKFKRCAPVTLTMSFYSSEVVCSIDYKRYYFQKRGSFSANPSESCALTGEVFPTSSDNHLYRNEDPIRSALSFLIRALKHPLVMIKTVKILEHPWYLTHDIDDDGTVRQKEKDTDKFPHTLEMLRELREVAYKCRIDPQTCIGWHSANHFNCNTAYFRTAHRRLLQGFGLHRDWFEQLIGREISSGSTQLISDQGLSFLSAEQKRNYREIEAKQFMPSIIVDMLSGKRNGISDFYASL